MLRSCLLLYGMLHNMSFLSSQSSSMLYGSLFTMLHATTTVWFEGVLRCERSRWASLAKASRFAGYLKDANPQATSCANCDRAATHVCVFAEEEGLFFKTCCFPTTCDCLILTSTYFDKITYVNLPVTKDGKHQTKRKWWITLGVGLDGRFPMQSSMPMPELCGRFFAKSQWPWISRVGKSTYGSTRGEGLAAAEDIKLFPLWE